MGTDRTGGSAGQTLWLSSPRKHIGEVLNPIFYVLSMSWQALPKALPPKKHRAFLFRAVVGTARWSAGAHPSRAYAETRERERREVSPTAAIIGSRSANGA